jgi:hypothetical protein
MEKKKFWYFGIVFFLCFLFPPLQASAYNANAASDYAFKWYKQYHPDYANYVDHVFSDEDANFVSQALIAGGLLNSNNIPIGIQIDSAGCITSREGLVEYLKDYEHFKDVGFDPGLVPTSLAFGDVVSFGPDKAHPSAIGIVIGYDPVKDDFDIAFHYNTSGGGVSAGNILTLQEVALVRGGAYYYHVTKPQETADKQRFYGTGAFFGPGSLSAEILQPGDNYLGFIVNNQNRSGQDMVIATDTSQPLYKGCSYLVSGFCCDPEKHTPSVGQIFGQPWTSDSPNHWAYWVRQAVIYATGHGLEPYQILNAVWYIVDRAGFPDEIISAIGYPEDGPIKLELVYLPMVLKPVGLGTGKVQMSAPAVKTTTTRPARNFREVYERKENRKILP